MLEKFCCFGVDDTYVEVVDDEGDWCSGVGSTDADVMHASRSS